MFRCIRLQKLGSLNRKRKPVYMFHMQLTQFCAIQFHKIMMGFIIDRSLRSMMKPNFCFWWFNILFQKDESIIPTCFFKMQIWLMAVWYNAKHDSTTDRYAIILLQQNATFFYHRQKMRGIMHSLMQITAPANRYILR